MSYQGKLLTEVMSNTNFRKVLFTGKKSQLVVMSIPMKGEIGEETHGDVEQALVILAGSGKAFLDGVESPLEAGDIVVVTPGTKHNIVNTGSIQMKIVTLYSPPNHIDGRVHATKAEADVDQEDEAFGHAVV
jgi:mannose-6-phosphate isomerase-like protein (cupin superfamily)